jgi:hypothetical protein
LSFPYDRSPNDPKAAIQFGRDFNYFSKITVSNTTWNTDADIVITFQTYTVTFQMEGTIGNQVQYSFNGGQSGAMGDMTWGPNAIPLYYSTNLTFDNRSICKIWFQSTGTGTAPVIRVEAWAIR